MNSALSPANFNCRKAGLNGHFSIYTKKDNEQCGLQSGRI